MTAASNTFAATREAQTRLAVRRSCPLQSARRSLSGLFEKYTGF
jgi:hypothetical protein